MEAHLALVKLARLARELAFSKINKRDWRLVDAYAAASEKYEKARRDSDAQRAKDDADALAAFKATE